jgi:hypothetical protein
MHCCIALAHWLQEELQVKPTTATNEIKDIYRDVTRLASAYQADQEETHVPIVLDTGASSLLTPFLNDFVGPIRPAPITSLNGLSAAANVSGVGTVEWMICNVFGVIKTIRTEAYYVPAASIWLFSPQVYFQENNDKGKCHIEARRAILHIPDGTSLGFPYNPHNNLPMMIIDKCGHSIAGLLHEEVGLLSDPTVVGSYLLVLNQVNQNITSAQKELLLWHQQLGHAGYQWNQALMVNSTDAPPILLTKHAVTGQSKTANLICTAC